MTLHTDLDDVNAAPEDTDAVRPTAPTLRAPSHAPATSPTLAQPPAEHAAIDARVAVLARDVRLSSRERTVLRLIALGYRYREIGCAMSISPRTVKMYATNLRRKVGGDTRWDLMRRVLAE